MKPLESALEMAGVLVNPHLEKALADGASVVGHLCSYVPGEIIHAAGAVPYRMRAVESESSVRADNWFGPLNCSFIRRMFDLALSGKYDFLSGIVFMNGCDHGRRLFDNWRDAKKSGNVGHPLLHMLVAPHSVSDRALGQYREELTGMARALEGQAGVPVTEERLAESIRLFNRKRGLLRRIGALRAANPAGISGSDFILLMLAVSAMPPEDAVGLLTEIATDLPGEGEDDDSKIRVLAFGGCAEDVEHIRVIEDLGGVVVGDGLCLGAREFVQDVSEQGDPLSALAERYLRRLSCPRMIDDFDSRAAYIAELVEETGADAVISDKLMFCDLWGGEAFLLRTELSRTSVPFLSLERELYGGGLGQMRTRVQAFFEQVRNLKRKANA